MTHVEVEVRLIMERLDSDPLWTVVDDRSVVVSDAAPELTRDVRLFLKDLPVPFSVDVGERVEVCGPATLIYSRCEIAGDHDVILDWTVGALHFRKTTATRVKP